MLSNRLDEKCQTRLLFNPMVKNKMTNKKLTRRTILQYGLYGMGTAGFSSSLWLNGCSKRPTIKGPNILLVAADTLRPDHLGCYGYHRSTSPNIDAFAAENKLFTNCFSHAPETTPSCASFLTGFLPHETKVYDNTTPLLDIPTLATELREAGYHTYGVVSNYILRKKMRLDQGFDIYDDQMDQRELNRNWPERTAENTTNAAIRILKKRRHNPFFMWVHYQDPHGPYTPPKPYDTSFINPNTAPLNLKLNRGDINKDLFGKDGIPFYQKLGDHTDYHYYVSQYDGEIRYFDDHFGRLLTWLKGAGLYDNTVIIFTSDHGEAMGEHEYYFVHGHNLSHCLIHVPFILKDGAGGSRLRTDEVQHLDIVPTVLQSAGVPLSMQYRGRDLRQQHSTPALICSQRRGTGASLISDGLKLINTGGPVELFDIRNDPQEHNNLSGDPVYEDRVKKLAQQLDRIRTEDFLGLSGGAKTLQLTEQEKKKLQSLGYVQ
jgi:arylsulfatase